MLGVHEWLPLTAFLMLFLQASESAKLRSKWLIMLYCVAPLGIALGADQYLVEYSVVQVHDFVRQYGEPLAGLILFEALLIACGKIKAPFITLSGLLAFLYLQMSFYQTGWFDWSFSLLALAFGAIGSLLMLVPRLVSQNLKIIGKAICCWLFLIIATAYAAFPASTDNLTASLLTELVAAFKSTSVLLLLSAAGYLSSLIQKHPNKKGVGI